MNFRWWVFIIRRDVKQKCKGSTLRLWGNYTTRNTTLQMPSSGLITTWKCVMLSYSMPRGKLSSAFKDAKRFCVICARSNCVSVQIWNMNTLHQKNVPHSSLGRTFGIKVFHKLIMFFLSSKRFLAPFHGKLPDTELWRRHGELQPGNRDGTLIAWRRKVRLSQWHQTLLKVYILLWVGLNRVIILVMQGIHNFHKYDTCFTSLYYWFAGAAPSLSPLSSAV